MAATENGHTGQISKFQSLETPKTKQFVIHGPTKPTSIKTQGTVPQMTAMNSSMHVSSSPSPPASCDFLDSSFGLPNGLQLGFQIVTEFSREQSADESKV